MAEQRTGDREQVTGAEPKVYQLLVPWRAAVGAANGIEFNVLEDCWCDVTRAEFSGSPGYRLRASSPQGQALLEAMLVHGYVREVTGDREQGTSGKPGA